MAFGIKLRGARRKPTERPEPRRRDQPPLGTIRISDWVPANAASLGRAWTSELARNYRLSEA